MTINIDKADAGSTVEDDDIEHVSIFPDTNTGTVTYIAKVLGQPGVSRTTPLAAITGADFQGVAAFKAWARGVVSDHLGL